MQFLAFEHDVYVAVFGMIAKFQFCEDARCWPLHCPISAVLGFCLQSPKEKICLCTSSLLYLPAAPMPSLQKVFRMLEYCTAYKCCTVLGRFFCYVCMADLFTLFSSCRQTRIKH